jgi:hypothetical protein
MAPVMDPVIAWISAREGKPFTLSMLCEEAGLPRRPSLRVCDKLAKEGYLTELADDPVAPRLGEHGPARQNPTWKESKQKPAAKRPKPRPARLTKRDRMWAYITDAIFFTVGDLQIALDDGKEQKREAVEDFIYMLKGAGYVREHGRRGAEKLWKLCKGRGQPRPALPDPSAGRKAAKRSRP